MSVFVQQHNIFMSVISQETCWAVNDKWTIIPTLNIISENVNQPSLNGDLGHVWLTCFQSNVKWSLKLLMTHLRSIKFISSMLSEWKQSKAKSEVLQIQLPKPGDCYFKPQSGLFSLTTIQIRDCIISVTRNTELIMDRRHNAIYMILWNKSLGDTENKTRLLSGRRRLHSYTISLSGIRSNGGYGCSVVLRYSRQYTNKPPVLTRLRGGGRRSRKKWMMMKIWRNVRRWKGWNVQWRFDQLRVLLTAASLPWMQQCTLLSRQTALQNKAHIRAVESVLGSWTYTAWNWIFSTVKIVQCQSLVRFI